jgi:hypothetical protein
MRGPITRDRRRVDRAQPVLLELPEKAGIDHSESRSPAAGKKFLSAAAVSPDPPCPVEQKASQNIIVKERCRILLPRAPPSGRFQQGSNYPKENSKIPAELDHLHRRTAADPAAVAEATRFRTEGGSPSELPASRRRYKSTNPRKHPCITLLPAEAGFHRQI